MFTLAGGFEEKESGSGSDFCGADNLTEFFNNILEDIDNQPMWRAVADREWDYKDGNQLDSAILARQEALGIPPAIEPVIGPTIDDVLGLEAKSRTDWRVLPDGDREGDDVAEALNYKLNQAERRSNADKACSDAYESQVSVGLGWVEVSRCSDPFQFPYRCNAIHRNEIWWDFRSRDSALRDCRWLLRRKWTDLDIAKKMFPSRADLLEEIGTGWAGFDIAELDLDGGKDTGLAKNWTDERGWTREEQEWRDRDTNRICLFELWYRKYEEILVLKFNDGRVVEYDADNEMHQMAAYTGISLERAVVGKMQLAIMAGPHVLCDGPTPYRHNKFPYVPFWGKREDRTGVPFGLIRGMMFLQDEINARISKMQWLLSAKRVVRTDGAVKDDDEVFRAEVARPDADIILNPEAMRDDGVFRIEQDAQLNNQQAQRLAEARESLRRISKVTDAFQGQDKSGRQSGQALTTLVEQSIQGLADINDNFKEGRAMVGELMLDLLINDIRGQQVNILVDGGLTSEDREIILNEPQTDPETGLGYLNNDTERLKMKVVLSDVPSTPSFRAQQMVSMSEAFKGAPPEFQRVMLPHLMNLMDIPEKEKKEIITAIRQLAEVPSEEQIQERIDTAVTEAMTKKMVEQKDRELDIKEEESTAKIGKLVAEEVRKNVESIYAAVQAGREILATPGVADSADQMLESAGFEDKDKPPIVAQGGGVGGVGSALPPEPLAESNTSPTFPPRASSPAIEPSIEEGEQPLDPENPAVGVGGGIEAPGLEGEEEI